MTKSNIKIPISFENLIKNNVERVDIQESIIRNLRFLVLTHIGDFNYDKAMGFKIWDFDKHVFYEDSLLETSKNADEDFKRSLKELIAKYENRLIDVEIGFDFVEIKGKNTTVYERSIIVTISGNLKRNAKPLKPKFEIKIAFTPFNIIND